jgi:hypothetical protein
VTVSFVDYEEDFISNTEYAIGKGNKRLDGTDYPHFHDKKTEYENIETVYHPGDLRDSLFELGLPLAGLEEEL